MGARNKNESFCWTFAETTVFLISSKLNITFTAVLHYASIVIFLPLILSNDEVRRFVVILGRKKR